MSDISFLHFFCRMASIFLTSSAAILTVHHTGRYPIAIPMCTRVTFLLQIFYETISISASFDMSKVLENARIPTGISTLISNFAHEASILQPVAGGQVRKERDH
jgi:hypothetical protein